MMVRIAAKHKAKAALLQASCNPGNSLIKKAIMPQIGVGIKRHRSKKNDARLSQCICRLHRNLKCGVVECSLGALHPVNNAAALGIGQTWTAKGDTRI